MGVLADLTRHKSPYRDAPMSRQGPAPSRPVLSSPTERIQKPSDDPRFAQQARLRSRAIWNEVFGTDKETGRQTGRPLPPDQKPGYGHKPVGGGSYGRSVAGGEASFVRLLQAMRSMAPGGWSDDRWEQTVRHFTGITYVAVHRICSQLQRAEFQVFRQDPGHPDGKRPVRQDEPAWDLVRLLKRPNNQDSFGACMYQWGQQIRLTGSALTWMVPNAFGQPCELYPIPTAIAIPQPAINPDYPDGYWRIQPVYPYGPFSSYPTPTTAVGAAIDARWMMKWKYSHPLLRYDGYSPQTAARLEMDSFEMINRSRFYSMKRGINPSAVLNMDDAEGSEPIPEAELERIRADFENEQQGPENMGKLFVAMPGAKLEPWGNLPRDMLYEAGFDQLAAFILGGVYGITKPAAGMVEDASYATLFATLKQLHLITLEPECQMIGSELTHKLAPFWGDDLIIEVRSPRIDDHDLKLGMLSALQGARAITKNEFRKELDMPVWHGPMGEEIAGTEPPPPMMPGMGMPGMPGQMPGVGMPGVPAALTPDGQPIEQGAPPQDIPMMPGVQEELASGEPMGIEGMAPSDPLDLLLAITEEDFDEKEVERQRQRQGPQRLSRGALGPRKSLDLNGHDRLSGYFNKSLKNGATKSLYERVREVLSNGH